VADPI